MTDVAGEVVGSRAPTDAADLQRCLAEAGRTEVPPGALCARIAELHAGEGNDAEAARWAVRAVDAPADYRAWRRAAYVLDGVCPGGGAPDQRRTVRLGVLGTATLTPLLGCLRLALARAGIGAELYEAPYGQYWQEGLDDRSGLRAFAPDIVVLVPDHRAAIPPTPTARWCLEEEVSRWTTPWDAIRAWSTAELVQVSFVVPENDAFGTAAASVPTSRRHRLRMLDAALADAAEAAGVAHVDADALAGAVGKRRWFEPRFWYAAKHPFAMSVAPELAVGIAGAVAARLGLSRRVVVVDLDDTVWGGVVGDDGVDGIRLSGPRGEAMVDLQHALRALSERGVILAACSKNDEEVARGPFLEHPDMVLRLDDLSAIAASWQPKPTAIRGLSEQLDLGLDTFVFLDDNPAEREAVRQALPEVDVLALAADPASWCDQLGRYPWLEPAPITDDDRRRAASYRARAAAAVLAEEAHSLEELNRSLEMRASVHPIEEITFARAVQLITKTNQFNLTGRRHSATELRQVVGGGGWVHLTARLGDRFADHGVVAVALARAEGTTLEVDTLVMSCRVIGRGLETVLLEALAAEAGRRGLRSLRGRYVPSERNGLVAGLWRDHGFALVSGEDGGPTVWELDLGERPPWPTQIEVEGKR